MSKSHLIKLRNNMKYLKWLPVHNLIQPVFAFWISSLALGTIRYCKFQHDYNFLTPVFFELHTYKLQAPTYTGNKILLFDGKSKLWFWKNYLTSIRPDHLRQPDEWQTALKFWTPTQSTAIPCRNRGHANYTGNGKLTEKVFSIP